MQHQPEHDGQIGGTLQAKFDDCVDSLDVPPKKRPGDYTRASLASIVRVDDGPLEGDAQHHEATSEESWHAAARDVRYRFAAGKLKFNGIRDGRRDPAHAWSPGAMAAQSEPPAEMALR